MKKVLSVILAAVMAVCCLPLTVFAENAVVQFTSSREFASSNELQSNTTYVIKSGVTMTVNANKSLYIPDGTRLEIEKGGTLNALGSVIVLKSGTLYCYGTIDHGSNVILNTDPVGDGEQPPNAQVQIRFPDLNSDAVKLADKVEVSYSYAGEDPQAVPVGGGSYFVPLNTEIRIKAHIIEPKLNRDKFDDSLLKVKFNNVGLTYVTGTTEGEGYFTTTASTGGDVSFAKWTNDADFLTIKKIVLPSGEGYECVPRYPDKVQKTVDGTIVVKYGDPFSFKVELDEAYDMSNYEVYIYNGYGWLNLKTDSEDPESLSFTNIAAERDAYGYYNIPAVTGDITVSVRGVMKNSTINLIGNLMETFKNIFNMLKEFIEGLKGLFGG